MAGSNQAGLGRISSHSFTLQHARPYLISDLGISSVSLQVAMARGALGTVLSHHGINGLGYTSAWVAYGMKLHTGLTAGLGLHFWSSRIPEQFMYHPGFSFAAGLQLEVNDQLTLGAHVRHPAGWYSPAPNKRPRPMTVTTGGSLSLFTQATYFAELEFTTGCPLQWKQGLEWIAGQGIKMQFGIHNQPFTVSGGIQVTHNHWNIHAAITYGTNAGSTPSTSFSYGW
jgi:hypothetical protein